MLLISVDGVTSGFWHAQTCEAAGILCALQDITCVFRAVAAAFSQILPVWSSSSSIQKCAKTKETFSPWWFPELGNVLSSGVTQVCIVFPVHPNVRWNNRKGLYLQGVGMRHKPEAGFCQKCKTLQIIVSPRLSSDSFLSLISIYRNTFCLWTSVQKEKKKQSGPWLLGSSVLWPYWSKALSNLLNLHFFSICRRSKGTWISHTLLDYTVLTKFMIMIIPFHANICLRILAECTLFTTLKTFGGRHLSWSARAVWGPSEWPKSAGSRGLMSQLLFPVYTKEAVVSSCLNKRTTKALLTFYWHTRRWSWVLLHLFTVLVLVLLYSGQSCDPNQTWSNKQHPACQTQQPTWRSLLNYRGTTLKEPRTIIP